MRITKYSLSGVSRRFRTTWLGEAKSSLSLGRTARSAKAPQGGFTIVELMLVIVVIAILAAITIVTYNGIQARANDSAKFAAARDIRTALELYKMDHGDYPLMGGPQGIDHCEHPSESAGHCSAGDLEQFLVPDYLASMPIWPGEADDLGYTARGNNGYALWLVLEAQENCRYLVNLPDTSLHFGEDTPLCR